MSYISSSALLFVPLFCSCTNLLDVPGTSLRRDGAGFHPRRRTRQSLCLEKPQEGKNDSAGHDLAAYACNHISITRRVRIALLLRTRQAISASRQLNPLCCNCALLLCRLQRP